MKQPHIYIHPFPFGLPSWSGHYSALSRVLCVYREKTKTTNEKLITNKVHRDFDFS